MPLFPSTKTVQNVLDAVKRLFGDESGAQVTDSDIIRWINEGQLEIARQNNYTETTVTTPSVSGQANYNLAGSNIMSIQTLSYNDYFVEGMTFQQVQDSYLNQQGTGVIPTVQNTSTPLVWYEYGDSIYFWPAPTVSGDTIKLFVCTYPAAVSSASDSLSVPDTLYRSLLSFVMAQAYEMDDDLQSSQVKLNLHSSLLDDVAEVTNNKSYPVITVLVEDL